MDEVISFAVTGIFDNPDSKTPIGQPVYAGKAYQDYMDWKEGKGRWPLLEASFYQNLKHDGISKSVTLFNPASSTYSSGNLTDGNLGAEDNTDKNWLGFERKDMIATIDLGSNQKINYLAARFLSYKPKNIFLPTSVEFSVSDDGKKFRTIKTVTMDQVINDRYDCWIDMATSDQLNESARFVRVYAINGIGQFILSDEILVNPKY